MEKKKHEGLGLKMLGLYIVRRRIELNVKQHELAEQLGRSQSWVSGVERGSTVVNFPEILAICEVLDFPVTIAATELLRDPTPKDLRVIREVHESGKRLSAHARPEEESA